LYGGDQLALRKRQNARRFLPDKYQRKNGGKRRIVIVVSISSSLILMKNLRRICDEKFFTIPVNIYKIIRYDVLLSLYMVEVRGSNPLSPTYRD